MRGCLPPLDLFAFRNHREMRRPAGASRLAIRLRSRREQPRLLRSAISQRSQQSFRGNRRTRRSTRSRPRRPGHEALAGRLVTFEETVIGKAGRSPAASTSMPNGLPRLLRSPGSIETTLTLQGGDLNDKLPACSGGRRGHWRPHIEAFESRIAFKAEEVGQRSRHSFSRSTKDRFTGANAHET